jgi:hypothetical protein
MAKNNIINDLYQKIGEINQLEKKISNVRIYFIPTIGVILWIIMLIDFLTSPLTFDEVSPLIYFGTLCILFISAILTYLGIGVVFWPTTMLKLEKKNKEFINYISNEDVQLAIINFEKLDLIKDSYIIELKKYFALKEYDNATKLLREIIESISYIEEKRASEADVNKLINDYEINLKMKL